MNKYIIDANIIFSALISGKELFIKLFEHNRFYAPDFVMLELDKYKSVILKKSKLPIENLQDFIQRLFKQITVIPELYITDKINIKQLTYAKMLILRMSHTWHYQ